MLRRLACRRRLGRRLRRAVSRSRRRERRSRQPGPAEEQRRHRAAREQRGDQAEDQEQRSGRRKIASNAVGAAKIAADAVTGAKIAAMPSRARRCRTAHWPPPTSPPERRRRPTPSVASSTGRRRARSATTIGSLTIRQPAATACGRGVLHVDAAGRRRDLPARGRRELRREPGQRGSTARRRSRYGAQQLRAAEASTSLLRIAGAAGRLHHDHGVSRQNLTNSAVTFGAAAGSHPSPPSAF